MTIGGGIFLIVLGAILAFGLEFDLAGVNQYVVGMILMIAGLAGVVLGFVQYRGASRVTRTSTAAPPAERVVEERRDVY